MNDSHIAGSIPAELFQKTLNSLRSHIAVLNEEGIIIAVNTPWNQFASRNGLAEQFCGPGINYLQSCDEATGECSEEASAVASGIREVIAGQQEYFYLEYPCHSPSEQRWFSVRVTRFEMNCSGHVVVAHDDITQRILAEFQLQETSRLLELQATTDGLTGVANRRSFDRTFEQEWKRHERTRAAISVAILDIDCFKQFNDAHGHLAGDDALKAVARAIQAVASRSGDFVARYGGEEFAVILPNTSVDGAATVLENALQRVRQLAIPHLSSKVSRRIVTVSIGFTTVIPSEHNSPSAVLHCADQALYEAKAKGRDRLKLFAPPDGDA